MNHFALTRSGSQFRYFLNGTLVETWSHSSPLRTVSTGLAMGALLDGALDPQFYRFRGAVEEFHAVKGVAMWTSNFTPPSSPYAGGGVPTYTPTPVQSTPTPTPAGPTPTMAPSATPAGNYPPPPPSGVNFLLQSGGDPHGSVSFADSSLGGTLHSITGPYAGTVRHDTQDACFGTSSLYFHGDQGRLEVADSADLDFGDGDFTLDFRLLYDNPAANHAIVLTNLPEQLPYGSGTGNFWLDIDTGLVVRPRFWFADSSEVYFPGGTGSLTAGQWHHVAITRRDGVIRYFLDGTLRHTHTASQGKALRPHANGLTAGMMSGGGLNPEFTQFKGRIEELRIIKGHGEWIGNFDPYDFTYDQVPEIEPTPTFAPGHPPRSSLLVQSGGHPGGWTGFADTSSSYGVNTLQAADTANFHHSTAQSKFGGSSIYSHGNGGHLRALHQPEFDFGAAPFTIDFWVYDTDPNIAHGMIAANVNNDTPFGSDGGNLWIEMDRGEPKVRVWDAAGGSVYQSSGVTVDNGWHHIALTRDESGWFRFFVDGTARAVWHNAHALQTNLEGLWFCTMAGGSTYSGYGYFEGYLEEIRVVAGYAAWTGDFDPPVSPYAGELPFEAPYMVSKFFPQHRDQTAGVALEGIGTNLQYVIQYGPYHGSVSNFNPAAGTFDYQPDSGYLGPDAIGFNAFDGYRFAHEDGIVSVDVIEPPDATPTPTPAGGPSPTPTPDPVANINTAANFPGPGFRAAVEQFMGVGPGGVFTAAQAAAKTGHFEHIDDSIVDLTGLEFFTGLGSARFNLDVTIYLEY